MSKIIKFLNNENGDTAASEYLPVAVSSAVKKGTQRAFTVIELLVVIAIIGILMSSVLAAFSGSTEVARDSRRGQDIKQIDTAIQMYINDNGQIPMPPVDENGWTMSHQARWDDFADDLSEYIDSLPVDPLNDYSHFVYRYQYSNDASGYDCKFDASEDSYMLRFGTENGWLSGFLHRDEDTPAAWTDGAYIHCVIR